MTRKEKQEIAAKAAEAAVAAIKAANAPPEKTIETMDAGELQNAVRDYLRASQRSTKPLPLPPGKERENFSPAEREVLNDAWVVNILAKKPSDWTDDERLAMRRAIGDSLQTI
jgi:hypothetical protein